MSALTGSTATAVAHWSESTRRSPAGFMPLMVHDVVGVRRRLPVMMRAGANTLIGFLNAMPFPARTKVSSQEPSWAQAPSSLDSTALAGDIAPDASAKASTVARTLRNDASSRTLFADEFHKCRDQLVAGPWP